MEKIGAGLTAVVIEDDESIRGLIDTTLMQAGFEVRSAAFGHEGVELVRRHSPDVVTLDVSLPDTNGFEVAKQLRQFSQAIIVMLTARTEEAATLLGLESGADDYLTKPFRPRELRARIQAILRRSQRSTSGSTPYTPLSTPSAITPASIATPARPTAVTPAPVVHRAPAWPSAATAGAAGTATVARTAFAPLTAPRLSRPAPLPDVRQHNGLEIDVRTRVTTVDGLPVQLTRGEADLLVALLDAAGRTLSATDLVRAQLAGDRYVHRAPVTLADERAAVATVTSLIRKLGDASPAPRFVEATAGGFRRVDPR